MYKFLINKKEQLFVVIISLFVTFLSSAKYFSQLLNVPKGHVFVGMSHYYEDFFYYLDQFYQGAHGGWLTHNNFTTETLRPTFIYLDNIILGKIGGLFGLESFVTYNLSLIILKFIFFILCYLLLTKIFPKNIKLRLASFVLFLFATSFPLINLSGDGLTSLGSITIFRAKNTFFSRFENIPGNYVQRILFVTVLLLITKYNELVMNHKIRSVGLILFTIILTILTMWLTLSNPVDGLIFILILILPLFNVYIRNNFRKYFHYFLSIAICIGLGFFITLVIMWSSINSDPVYLAANIWDYNEYVKQFGLLSIFRQVQAFGMFGALFIIGTISLIKRKRSITENILLSISYISILGFLLPYMLKIPIPGFRFLTVTTYLFISAIAVHGILFIETILNKKIFFIVIFIYLSISAFTIYPRFLKETAKVEEPTFHFTYIPRELYDGLIAIRNLSPKNAIVLANPLTDTDLYIPGLTGKKVFTGHSLTTLNAKEKDKMAAKFYYEWTDSAIAVEFLKKNNIKYILHTKYSNNFESNDLQNVYPFLKEIYRNNIMAIFTY
jgi:hypothetical protein